MLSAVPPPVTVRVPAKINLHLAVGGLRADGFHDLVTVFHAVSLFDERLSRGRAAEPGDRGPRRGRHRGARRRDQPGLARGPAARRSRRPRSRRLARAAQGHPGRGGHGGRQRRRGRRAARAFDPLEARPDPRRALGPGRRARQRRHVRPARRHRAGHRSRRADRPGTGAAHPALGDRAAPGRAVHARRVPRARPPARNGTERPAPGPSSRCWRPSRAATRASSRSRSATTCSPPPSAWPPSCAAPCGPGSTRARSRASSPAPGPRARSSARADSGRRRRDGAGRARGVPHRPRRTRPGARRPRRRGAGAARPVRPAPLAAGVPDGGPEGRPTSSTWRRCRGFPGDAPGLLDGVSLGRRVGRPHRRRRAQRRRQDHIAGHPHRRPGTRRGPRQPRRRAAARAPGAGRRAAARCARARRRAERVWRRPRVGRRPQGARGARRARRARRWTARSTGSPAARSAGSRWRGRWCSDLDLLVLDEPTNHLDVEGIGWLAEHLVARRCAVVVVTHDRWFLDAVCTRTWEVAGGQVEDYLGGYADWIFARAERARQADAAEARRQNLARKELAWLRRGPPARTSKPRYRIEAAEALIADVPAAAGRGRAARVRDQPPRPHRAGAGGRDGQDR